MTGCQLDKKRFHRNGIEEVTSSNLVRSTTIHAGFGVLLKIADLSVSEI